MNDQFVTYEIANKLKELGFNVPCLAVYGTNGEFEYTHKISQFSPMSNSQSSSFLPTAPLWQQAIDWLREKYGYHFELIPDEDTGEWYCISYYMLKMSDTNKEGPFKTFQEAREAGVVGGLNQ